MSVLADWIVIWPLIVPMLATALGVVFFRQAGPQTVIGIGGAVAHVAVSVLLFAEVWTGGTQVMAMGGWLPPFGIAFAADTLSAALVLLTSIVGLLAALYGTAELQDQRLEMSFHPLLSALIFGCTGAFLTGDIFNLYVWFEVILIASFGLLVLGSGRIQLDGAVKYAVINFLATTLFLIATGLLYGAVGTLNFADISQKMAARELDGTLIAVGVMFLIAFGMKAAVFPVFFWLPASYHTPAAVVSGVFSGLLTKVGVYALFRVFTLVFPLGEGPFAEIFLIVALATMTFGVIGALGENDLRRLISYLVISGIGLMLAGLAVAGRAETAEVARIGLMGAVFYIGHSILVTTALALMAGLAAKLGGTHDLRRLAGLYRERPVMSFTFLLLAFAMAGIPPLTGFWPKVFLVQANLSNADYIAAGVILLSGFLTTIALGRAWALAFWRDRGGEPEVPVIIVPVFRMATIGVLALMVLGGGIFGNLVSDVAVRAADELADPSLYQSDVLGTGQG